MAAAPSERSLRPYAIARALVFAAACVWVARLRNFHLFFAGAPLSPYRPSIGYLDELILIAVSALTLACIVLSCFTTGDDRFDRHDTVASRVVVGLFCLLACSTFTPGAFWLYALAIVGIPGVFFFRLLAALVKTKVPRSFQSRRIGVVVLTISLGVFLVSAIEFFNPIFVIAGT